MKWPKCCPVGRYSTSRDKPRIIEDAPRASGFPRQVLVWGGGGGGGGVGGGGGDRGGLGADPQVGSTIFRRLHASPAQAVPPWTSPECGELVLLLCWSESDQLWYFGEIVGEGGLLVGVWRQINSGSTVRKSSLLFSINPFGALQWPLYNSGAGKKTHCCWVCKWPLPLLWASSQHFLKRPLAKFPVIPTHPSHLENVPVPFSTFSSLKETFPLPPSLKVEQEHVHKAHGNLRKTKSGAWQSETKPRHYFDPPTPHPKRKQTLLTGFPCLTHKSLFRINMCPSMFFCIFSLNLKANILPPIPAA